MSQNYTLIKGFLNSEGLENYISSTKRFVKRFYNEHHLKNHSAYFSDQSDNRESYGFTVWNGKETSSLPAISNELISEVARNISFLNLKIMEKLEVSDQTRLLFNVQMYKGNCKPVPQHFDGEYFDFEVQEDASLKINRALRSEKVAVLVLANDTDGGGTRLHYPDGFSEVVIGEPGDLLIFDNVLLNHSVDELVGTVKREDSLIRMTIGWRSLEEKTHLIYDGEMRGVSTIEDARNLHRDFLVNRWKQVYEQFAKDGKLPAF